ncbi:unnamed protein product [Aspergillus oryzae]|uniref:Unnamed protein product n=2 Tax=Aspergillus oryzae TaxID=5062 RepID=A0AAN5BWU2_ASPOZ|nr:unnamed protein product [Aspergillus oryzae]GMF94044.1 unnamed protein product [Aspergillus oryzae]GMG07981.1 unnamed protein product [Aspergillus oryzae]GMG28466.1 unnamed protein product [Aspergillus oryzae]GMG41525.1 unnamed protein product [Aspergillus oryzae var. brunneus]
MSETNQRLIVITINGYRKPGLTEEELHHHLCEIDNFSAARPHAEYLQMSKKLSDHDYIVQFVMKDVEDFKKVWEDPEFRKNVMPDHETFADTTRSGYVPSYT